VSNNDNPVLPCGCAPCEGCRDWVRQLDDEVAALRAERDELLARIEREVLALNTRQFATDGPMIVSRDAVLAVIRGGDPTDDAEGRLDAERHEQDAIRGSDEHGHG
jgi:hypothetical protein